MKPLRCLFLAVAMSVALLSCSKPEIQEEITIEITPTNLVFDALGAAPQTVQVTTNVKEWKATPSAGWITATPAGDYKSLQVSVTDNKSSLTQPSEARRGEVIVEGEGVTRTIRVSQYKDDAVLGAISNADELLTWIATPDVDGELVADIDMAGKEIPQVNALSATLKGSGHTISNLKVTAPVIKKLSGSVKDIKFSNCTFTSGLIDTNDGTVSGISFDSTCSLSYPVPTESCSYGLLVNVNNGTVENCSTAVVFDEEFKSLPKASVYFGGLVGQSFGKVKGCTNTGKFAIYITAPATGTFYYFGGIIGYVEGKAGEIIVQNCTNEALIQVKYDTSCYFFTGGVVGGSKPIAVKQTEAGNYGIIDGCVNKGNLNEFFTNGGSGSYPQVAGIISYHEGYIQNCENFGDIHIKCDHASNTWTGVRLAGIAGTCSAGMNNCKNHGHITVDAVVAGGTLGNRGAGNTASSSFAGVCCCAGPFVNPSNSAVFENCSNDADLLLEPNTVKGSPDFAFGGVFAWATGAVKNCTNTGSVTVNSPAHGLYVAGVAGQAKANISGCKNSGKIVSDVHNCPYTSKTWTSYVGGVCGYYQGASGMTVSGCSNSGDITLLATGGYQAIDNSYVSGVVGYKSLEASTIASDCTNSGKVTNGTPFSNVIKGNIYAPEPEAPIDPSLYYAEGHVLDNSGNPCVGISVSDGFNTCVTDSNGYYKLSTSTDTYYIYYSIPNYAKIEKNELGCPDFYKRYVPGETTYDFTITRQAVEDEFALFVLGDPQAHFKIKGTQQYSGTDRFLNESVPAMNGKIAQESVPCYGVTMGDVVYSSDGVNSLAGMPVMREHISKLNMPVFQTMGNHDYNYKANGTAIATDAHSSTINLWSQRAFEDAFGPIDHSFDRGNVHIICMKNIHTYCTTSWNASNYKGEYTDSQLKWLQDDLANVPKDKMVILCSHVPLYTGESRKNVSAAINLIAQYTNPRVFTGHTHYKASAKNLFGTKVEEHVHNAVCGCFWYGNICADGTPQGYTIYNIKGTTIENEHFWGVNGDEATRGQQMRIYRGNTRYGGPQAYFQMQNPANEIHINLFNASADWKLEVYEDGVYSGEPQLMPSREYEFTPDVGAVINVPTDSYQDWWSIGYYAGILGRSYYYVCKHMYKYTLKDVNAKVKVVATDPYGNVYECSEVVEDGTAYPSWVTTVGYGWWK